MLFRSYRLGLKGPDHSALFDAQANLLGEWDEEGAEPTTFKNNTLYLNWNGKTYRCRPISSN